MRRAIAGFWWSPTMEGTPALIVSAAFFAFGGLVGFLLALWTAEGGMAAMAGYLDRFLMAVQSGALEMPAMWELLWRTLRWPVAAFLLGYTALGLLGIPVLTALRGFFLAFSIASFAQTYGRGGLTMAFLLLGLPAVAYVPAFLLLATQSFAAASSLAGRGAGQGRREPSCRRDYLLCCGACAAATCVGLFAERYWVPVLVTGWSNMLLP